MPDNYICSALAPYGCVVGVQHLTVRGFPNVRTGTRMVSMSILKPIPMELTISNFKCSVKYRGHPNFCFGCRSFGHLSRLCPKLSGRSKGPRTMADVVSSTASLSRPTVASGLSECPTIQHMDTTQPAQPLVGAVTSRDSVSPSSSPLTLAIPDSMPSRIAPETGHSSDSEPPQSGLSIHLSQFKESVTFHGEFSYSRRVSVLKRMAKTSSTRASPVRGSARAQRLEHFSVRHNVSGISISAVSSEEHIELRPSSAVVVSPQPSISAEPHLETVPPSAILTSNRFSVLTDEATDLEAIAETVVDPLASPPPAVSPSVVPPSQTAVLAAEPLPHVVPTPPAAISASSHQGGAEFTSPPSTSRSASTGPTATSVDHIPSGAAGLPAPHGESVVAASNSSATASPTEPSLQLHLYMSEQPAESVVSLAIPSPVGGNVEPPADTSVSQAPVCTNPSVPPFVHEPDDAASSTAEFSPPPYLLGRCWFHHWLWVLLLLQLQALLWQSLLWQSLRTPLLCRDHGSVTHCSLSCPIFSLLGALILRAL